MVRRKFYIWRIRNWRGGIKNETSIYILLRRIHDPYGCLEDNEDEIVGVFDNLELAEKIEKQKRLENEENKKSILNSDFDYRIEDYNINIIYE